MLMKMRSSLDLECCCELKEEIELLLVVDDNLMMMIECVC